MRGFVILLLLPLAALLPTATAAPACAPDGALCAGEATQACGDPAPYGDGWDGFTGVWGNVSGVEFGAGGWDRCYPDDWSAGAFVNMDKFPAGRYETVQARYDSSPHSARPCYLSAGAYGFFTRFITTSCPDSDQPAPIPNPGWGHVLG